MLLAVTGSNGKVALTLCETSARHLMQVSLCVFIIYNTMAAGFLVRSFGGNATKLLGGLNMSFTF